MQINSDKAIARARKDFRRYGSNWFTVFAAARRDEYSVLHLPREEPALQTATSASGRAKPKTSIAD